LEAYLISLKIILICRKKGDQADAAAEVSYMTYVSQAKYELLTGCPEVAIGYLDRAVALKPEDELPYVARSKCLNSCQYQHTLTQI
jgi:hypothetical protein